MIAGLDVQSGSVKSAIQARTPALKAAWTQVDGKARRDTLKSAWDANRKMVKSARDSFKMARKAAWDKFNTDRKACGLKGEKDESDMRGTDGQL